MKDLTGRQQAFYDMLSVEIRELADSSELEDCLMRMLDNLVEAMQE